MYYSEHVTVQSSNAEEAKLRKPLLLVPLLASQLILTSTIEHIVLEDDYSSLDTKPHITIVRNHDLPSGAGNLSLSSID
jgi:hypothetical protein